MSVMQVVGGSFGRSARAARHHSWRAVLLVMLAVVGVGVVALPASAATVADPPTIGTATPGVASASVAFTPPVNDGGSTIRSYTATCLSSNGGGAGATSGASSPISVSPLTNGKTYTCTVVATNGVGDSNPSVASNAVVPATVPDPPTIGTATAGFASVSVAFTGPTDNGGNTITSYTATCGSSDGGAPGNASGASSPIVVSALTNGKTYSCSVTATNGVGDSGVSAASSDVVLLFVPGAPTIGTATAGAASVSVAFTGPTDDGGSPITSYTVTCLSSDGGADEIASDISSPIVVEPLSNGNTYTCSVTATNAVGDSAPSASSNVVVPATVPGAPTIGAASGGLASVSVGFSPPANNGGSPITGYTARCSSSNGGVSGSASGGSSPVIVTGLSNGASYKCFVIATNAVGQSSPSALSNIAIPAATVPDAPTIGTATPGNALVTVAFTPPANGGGAGAITNFTASCVSSNGGVSGTADGTTSPIDVTGLTNGSTYTCSVTATNGIGTSFSSAASNAVIPVGPPDPPTMGGATSGVASASVTFTAPVNNGGSAITSYTATCVSTDGVGADGSATGATDASPIVVSPLMNGDDYTCTVTATNGAGTSSASDPSNDVVPATVPDAPTIGTAVSGNGGVGVLSTPPADNGGSAILSYTARCVPTTGGTVQKATRFGPTSSNIIVPVVSGKLYTCSVTATNSVGQGGASAASNVIGSATAPGAPTIGTATSGNTSASVTFTAPGSNGGNAIISYTATCTSSNGGVTGSASGPSSPIVVSALTNTKTYTCTVKATNNIGTGPASAASNAVVPAPTAPGAPTIGTATGGIASVSVAFTAPASNGGSTITSYTATCMSSNGGVTGSASGPSSPITVGSLTNAKTYTCTVTATNAVNTGPPSAASNAATPTAVAPGAPTIGTATRGNGSASVAFTAPGSDGGSTITSYAATCVSSNSGVTGSASGASSPITVPGLTNGKTYTCKVTATNVAGTGPASAASNAVVPATVPGAPTIGTATSGNGTVSVTFTAPASNGGSAITSYTARCVSSNGGAAGNASGATSPITVALTLGKTYTCSVTATNAVGQGGASAATAAFVEGAPGAPTGTTATAGTGQATVSWTAPAVDNGSPVTGYVITAFVGFAPVATQTFNSTATTQMFTGLTSGTTYGFKVAAVNARGTGPQSTLSNHVTPS